MTEIREAGDVASFLLAERLMLHLSQQGMADRIGRDVTWVTHLERHAGDLKISSLLEVLDALGFRLAIVEEKP